MTTQELAPAETPCVYMVPGCAVCREEYEASFDVGHHSCSGLCEVFGEMKRDDPEYHRISHEPSRCDRCNHVLDDHKGTKGWVTTLCRSGYCTEWRCERCNHLDSSAGPVLCPSCGSMPRPPQFKQIHVDYRRKRKGRW